MIASFIARKVKQTQYFDQAGRRLPVTVLEAGPCPVVQIKDMDRDGYTSIQLGFGTRKISKNPQVGHAKKARLTETPRFLREFRVSDAPVVEVGTVITVDQVFAPGDEIAVTGVSKGKGFAGVVKRHHFRGGPATHGQSDRERAPGSVGGTTTPGRVYKGKRMAGRMGSDTVTIKGLKVMAVDSERNLLTISGLVPGAANSLIMINRLSELQAKPEVAEEVKPETKEEVKAEEKPEVKEPKEEKVEAKAEVKEEKEVKKEVKEAAPKEVAEEKKTKE